MDEDLPGNVYAVNFSHETLTQKMIILNGRIEETESEYQIKFNCGKNVSTTRKITKGGDQTTSTTHPPSQTKMFHVLIGHN